MASTFSAALLPHLTRLHSLRCLIVLLAVWCTAATAQQRFESSPHQFSVELPPNYETVSVGDPRVALAARPTGGGYPTLTITVESGPFILERLAPVKVGKRIEEGYHGVGLLDAKLKGVTYQLRGGREMFDVRLEYTQSAQHFTADVTEITVPERRITVTWLGPTPNIEEMRPALDGVLHSLTVESSLPLISGLILQPNDIGPIYAETQMGRFPVEPWNTASNIVFLALLIIFGRRTQLDRRRYPFLVPGLFVLAVGFVGGTVYHATRSHNVWLFLDFLPILLLTGAASLYFWFAVIPNRWVAVGLALMLLVSGRILRVYLELPKNLGITLSYLGAALAILLPAALHAAGAGKKHRRFLVWAALFFATALLCRFLDNGPGLSPLPMGTHFMWHLFGGLSVGALLHYIARIEEERAASRG